MAKNDTKKINYKALTRQITGMTSEQYNQRYRKFAAQVRNYNAITGAKYSAAREFYYSYKYADAPSAGLQGIQATSATRSRVKGQPATVGRKNIRLVTDKALSVFLDTWAGFAGKSRQNMECGIGRGVVANIYDRVASGELSVRQGNQMLSHISKELYKRRHGVIDPKSGMYIQEPDPVVGSP